MSIYGLAWMQNGITYNGEICPLTYDMTSQFMPNIASLRYVLKGDNSIFFNWGCDMGGDYYSLFALTMFSPYNLLSIFWQLSDMPNAIYVITLFKVGSCGLSFCFFIRYALKKQLNRWGDIAFCCCYALMSYTFSYGSCMIWFDTLIVLPICLIFVEKIIYKKNPIPYSFTLAWLICVNYYMAYAAGLYVFLYFMYDLISQGSMLDLRESAKRIADFIIYSLLGILISMPVVFAPLLRMADKVTRDSLFVEGEEKYASETTALYEKMKALLPQNYYSLENTGVPYIYCGTIIILMTLLFFFTSKNTRRKIASLVLILPIAMGFAFEPCNLFWQSFQASHGYPYRYSYLFSTSLIIVAYKYYYEISQEEYSRRSTMIASCIIVYTFCEIYLNGTFIISQIDDEQGYLSRKGYDLLYQEQIQLIEIATNDAAEDDGFYRIAEDDGLIARNNAIMYNYSGTGYFSSCNNSLITDFLCAMGCDSSLRIENTSSGTPFMNSILSIKYILSMEEMQSPYIGIGEIEWDGAKAYVYKNPYAISTPAVLIDGEFASSFIEPGSHPYKVNSDFFSVFSNDTMYKTVECIGYLGDNSLEILIEKTDLLDSTIYIYLGDMEQNNGNEYSASVYTIDRTIRNANKGLKKKTIALSRKLYTAGQDFLLIIGNVNNTYSENSVIYQIDYGVMEKATSDLKKNGLQNFTVSKNGFSGEIISESAKTLIFTLPYEKGFRVYVDGQRLDTFQALDVFLAVNVDKGEHLVEVCYVPYGFETGIVIGCVGICAFHWLYYTRKKELLKLAEL